MANTYTQIHLQLVFGVKYREALIHNSWKIELYKEISGIIRNQKHKLLIINGVEDHIHILVGFRPHQSLAALMQDVKGSSSKWINDRGFLKKHFEWQAGYGAFSYCKKHTESIIRYIENQEVHHRKINLVDEYMEMLKEHEIDYDPKYILKMPE